MEEETMGKQVEEVVEVQETQEEKGFLAELIIRVNAEGGIEVNVPDGARELTPMEVEGITRSVYEQLRDTRIAQQAVEMFKSKLG